MSPGITAPPSDRILSAVYYAMIAGVAMFAVILVTAIDTIPAGEMPFFRPVWLLIAGVAILAVGLMRGRVPAAMEPAAKRQMAIVIWALAEGPTLFGLVGYMLTGDRVLLFAPLAFFAVVMLRYRPGVFS